MIASLALYTVLVASLDKSLYDDRRSLVASNKQKLILGKVEEATQKLGNRYQVNGCCFVKCNALLQHDVWIIMTGG